MTNAEDYKQQAEANILAGNLEAAVMALESAIQLKPDLATAYLVVGNALQKTHQLPFAIWAYTQALDIDPQLTEALANLGSVYYQLKRFTEAIDCYQDAVKIDRDYAIVHWMLGNAFTQTNQLEKAIRSYQTAIELQPDQVNFHLKLAHAWEQQQQWQAAIACYQQVLKLQPQHPEATQKLRTLLPIHFTFNSEAETLEQFEPGNIDFSRTLLETELQAEKHSTSANILDVSESDNPWMNPTQINKQELEVSPEVKALHHQAEVYLNQAQYQAAIATCHQVLKLKPDFAAAYITLGNILQTQNKITSAIRAYQQAVEINPNFAEVYVNLGTMYLRLGEIETGIEFYQKALKIEPNLAAVYWNLGKVYQKQGKQNEALENWQKALEIQPDLVDAKFSFELGNALARKGQWQEAIKSYQRTVKLDPNWAEGYANIGCVFAQQGDQEHAISYFQQAIKIKPNLPELHLHTAHAYARSNQYERAIQHYQKLAKLQPNESLAYANLGNVYCTIGDINSSIKSYQKALEIQPRWPEVYCRLAHIQKQQSPHEAVTNLEKAIEQKPDFKEAYQQLCDLLSHSTNLAKARKVADQYCENCADIAPILSKIAYIFAYTQSGACQPALEKLIELEQYCYQNTNKLTVIEVNIIYEILLFTVSHLRESLEKNSKFTRFIANFYYQNRQKNQLYSPNYNKKNPLKPNNFPLKIGFLSKHFRRHSVGWCSEAVIRELTQITPHVHLYVTGQLPADEVTQRFEKMASKFYRPERYPNGFASSEELTQEIKQDKIDILIDLDSITIPVNAHILYNNPAPVCVSWLGFDAPYVSEKNYFLCDRYTHPPNVDQYYLEKLVRLPTTAMAVQGFSRRPVDKASVRTEIGVDTDKLMYLCVAPGRKMNQDMIQAQVKILQAIPDSILVRKGQGDHKLIRKMYDQACEKYQVNSKRILFIALTKTEEEHRAIYEIADVLLDSYPYNGGTHNLEALWSTIPVVTHAGEQYLSRMGYAFLKAVNLDIGVAWSWEEYTALGIQLGQNPQLRDQIRNHLTQAKQPQTLAPLWNPRKLAQEMYQVLQQLFNRQ
ncbi:MAG: tetratricopeptide repeat protein [Microcoleaceae cyanobacterium]